MAWNDQQLSPEGSKRRDAMCAEISRELVRLSRRRRTMRRSVVGAAVLALSGGALWWVSGVVPQAPNSVPLIAHAPDRRTSPEADHVRVEIIRDTPVIEQASVLTVRVAASDVRLSDEDLLRELEALGRPAGLAVVNGQAVLTAPVTDEAIEENMQPPLIPSQAG